MYLTVLTLTPYHLDPFTTSHFLCLSSRYVLTVSESLLTLNLDPASIQAVYRDLSILTAAYITEGRQKENHSRALVPAVLARPFYAAAKRVDQQLIMEYSS